MINYGIRKLLRITSYGQNHEFRQFRLVIVTAFL